MADVALRTEERVALALAVAAHVGLIVALALRPADKAPPVPPRMQVTLSDDVGLTATSPDPQAQAAPDLATTLGEAQAQAQAQPQAQPAPAPKPVPQPAPKVLPPPPTPPRPVAILRPEPVPMPRIMPKPRPVATHTPTPPPVAKPAPRDKPRPEPDPIGAAISVRNAAKPAAKSTSKTPAKPTADPIGQAISSRNSAPPRQTRQPEGGSRIGVDFLKGAGATASGKSPTAGAAIAGPAVRTALAGAISRQLKPHWRVPQGVDTDQLVTVLSFDLNRDGTLAGPVQVVSQDGITPSNRPQADIHKENAIRAVKLAQPFPLPAEFYDAWRHVKSFRFDRNLSQ